MLCKQKRHDIFLFKISFCCIKEAKKIKMKNLVIAENGVIN